MNILRAIKKGLSKIKPYIVAEDSDEPGKVYIVTQNKRVEFRANLDNYDDFNRAIDLLIEERDILFPNTKGV